MAGLLVALAGSTLLAQVRVEAVIGFDGMMVRHHPNPLTMIVHNDGSEPIELDLRVIRRGLEEEAFLERSVSVSGGVGRALTFLVPSDGMFVGSVEFTSGSGPLSFEGTVNGKAVDPVSSAQVWRLPVSTVMSSVRAVALGGRGRQIVGALPPQVPDDAGRPASLFWEGEPGGLGSLDEAFAPDTWLAWSGVETVLWTEPDPGKMADPAQMRALLQFVEFGGRLVILTAHRRDRLAAPELAAVLPAARFEADPGTASSVRVRPVSLRRGARRSPSGRIVEMPVGNGWIVVALTNPLAEDVGDPRRFARAVGDATGARIEYKIEPSRDNGRESGRGYGGAEFRNGLLNGNVLTPPMGVYVFLGMLYLLLIGPLDYQWLKRRKKLRWSPFTLILYTLLFTAISLGATFLLFAPSREVNRIAILDYTEGPDGSSHVSGWSYLGIYVPTGGRFDTHVPGFDAWGTIVLGNETVFRPTGRMEEPTPPQRFVGAGCQPLDLTLGFNSFRQTATRFAGSAAGGLDAVVEATPDGWEVRIHNGLDQTIRSVRILAPAEITGLGDLPPGGEAVVRIVMRNQHLGLADQEAFQPASREPWMYLVIGRGDGSRAAWGYPGVPIGFRDLLILGKLETFPDPGGTIDDPSALDAIFVRRRLVFPDSE